MPFKSLTIQTRSLTWIILGYAVILRGISYFINRSLWIDEAMLSLNIIHQSWWNLITAPMAYNQVAPVGFLLITKGMVAMLGHSEAVLRLFPFLCSLLALGLFHRLSRQLLSDRGSLIALALFAVSRGLVYYAGEVKQYESDALIAILILSLGWHGVARHFSFRMLLWAALLGAVSIWLSYPAFFMLLGVGITWLICVLFQRRRSTEIVRLVACLLTWLGSMAVYYSAFLEPLRHSAAHQEIWRQVWDRELSAFMPSLLSGAGWQWIAVQLPKVFKFPVGLDVYIPAFLGYLAGLFFLFRSRNTAQRVKMGLLTMPLLVTLVMSAAHLYPFTGRLLLFLVPGLILALAHGVDQLWVLLKVKWDESIGERTPRLFLTGKTLGWILLAILLLPPICSGRTYLHRNEEIKPLLKQLEALVRPSDIVYAYYGAQPALSYYRQAYHLPSILGLDYGNYVQGMAARHGDGVTYLTQRLAPLSQASRFWIVFSHVSGKEERRYLRYLATRHIYPAMRLEAYNVHALLFKVR